MSRINTNVASLVAQQALAKNNAALNQSLQRLSTGLRINSGADDPAGLIAANNLQSEKTGISTAIDNASRASNIVGTAEGGLNEVSSLLDQLNGLVGQSANTGGLSQEEKDANQLQVDSILNTINRISGSTSFEGKQLLNGNLDYTTNTPTNAQNIAINSAAIPDGGNVNIVADVVSSANTGLVKLDTTGVGGGLSALSADATFQFSGNTGTQQISFAAGTSYSQVATAVNALTGSTGVVAATSGNTVLKFTSQSTGSDQYVTVKVVSESAAAVNSSNLKDSGGAAANGIQESGTDAVVNVNGAAASAHGSTVTVRNANVDLSFDLNATSNVAGGTASFTITGGGATFNLGSKVSLGSKASIGVQNVATTSLGDSTTGFLSSLASGGANDINSGNGTASQAIIDKAIKQVSELRGRLGAFQKYTIGSTVNSLNVALQNVTSAQSTIQDADFASETANLTRNQILSQAASTVLSQANSAPQAVLSLLRGG